MCDTPIPGVLLTTRQPVETCEYRVSRYHTHLSHILKPIPAYLIPKYTKIYDRLFNQQSFYTTKRHTCSARIYYMTKTKQNKASSDSHPKCGPICGSNTCTGPVLERGVPRRDEQSPVVIISYMSYSPPKCSCNDKHTHSSEFMIHTRMSTCPISCLESSPTLSHMLVPCMKIVSKQKYLFYLWATLIYKYVGQSSKVNLMDNSPKQFMGLSDVNCWMISQHNSSDNFPIKFSFDNPQIFIHLWTYSDNQL